MTSKNPSLPNFVIATLFRESLVEIVEGIATFDSLDPNQNDNFYEEQADALPVTKNYLGGNAKNLSIVISDEKEDVINEDDLQFLTNILTACKYSLNDISIFNIYNKPVIFNQMKEDLGIKHFILFGVEPTEIKIPFIIPHFQVQQYAGTTIVTAPPLATINAGTDGGKVLKSKLWLSLKRCFNL